MNVPQLLELARVATTEGGSGHGMSYFQDACQCGMRALLRDEERSAGSRAFTQLGEGPLIVGSVYHKLMELLHTSGDVDLDFNEPLCNKSVASAVELFAGWRGNWEPHFWGTTVAVERQLPTSEAGAAAIRSAMIGHDVTAKVDLCVDISEEDLERVRIRCPAIPSPGRYLVDWKTSASAYPASYYGNGLQAIWYPAAWEMEPETGDEPIIGTIFDIIVKPRWNAKDRSFGREKFAAHFVPHTYGGHTALHGMLAQAGANLTRARDEGVGNRAECVKFAFNDVSLCPFYGSPCEGR